VTGLVRKTRKCGLVFDLGRSRFWSSRLNENNTSQKTFTISRMSRKGPELLMCFYKDQHKGEDEHV